MPTASVPSLRVSIRRMSRRWRGIELQRAAARLGFGRAEHHPDLLPDLVGEQADCLSAIEISRKLPQRLRHQTGLQAYVLIAHLALELHPRGQGRHGVDRDHVDGAGAHQHVDDLERLLAVVGLGDQQLVGVDADLPRVGGVDGVLGVDEGADPAARLGLGDDVVDEGRLPGGLGPEDLDDAAARDPAHAEGDVQGQRAGGDRLHVDRADVSELHQRALPEVLLDLLDRRLQRLVARLRVLLAGLSQVGLLICHHLTSLHLVVVGGRKLQLGQGLILRAGSAQMRLEEHQTSRTEEAEHVFGQRVR